MAQASLRADVFQRVPCQLGEGPCWHAARGTLWWADIPGKKLFESSLENDGAVREVPLPQLVGVAVPASDGGLIAALHEGIYRVDPDTGAIASFAEVPGHNPQTMRFNDGKVDPQGRLWAGTLALDGRGGQAQLYRIASNRTVTPVLSKVSLSNGLDWSPDGKTFYYVDTPTCRVQAFDFEGEKGELSNGRTAISLGPQDGWPDGCCVDAEGCLWLAHWGAGKLTRWDPSRGRLLNEVRFPVKNVTSCAFAGPKLDRLFVTTARDDATQTPEPEAGFVFEVAAGGVAGQAIRPFRLPGVM